MMTHSRLALVREFDVFHHVKPKGDPHAGDLLGIGAGQALPPEMPEVRNVYLLRHVHGDRGNHAHRLRHQVLWPLRGSFWLHLDDGTTARGFLMNDPLRAIYVPPLVWLSLDDFSPDAECLVMASLPYDEAEYIRDREAFRVIASLASGEAEYIRNHAPFLQGAGAKPTDALA